MVQNIDKSHLEKNVQVFLYATSKIASKMPVSNLALIVQQSVQKSYMVAGSPHWNFAIIIEPFIYRLIGIISISWKIGTSR